MNKSYLTAFAITFVVLLAGCNSPMDQAKPTDGEAKVALKQFLNTEYGKHDNLSLTGPRDVAVGSYNDQVEGWPIYATYMATFTRNGVQQSAAGSVNAKSMGGRVQMGRPACYICKADGRFFCFKSDLAKTMDTIQAKMQEVILEERIPQGAKPTREQMMKMQKGMQEGIENALKDMNRPSEAEIKRSLRDSMPRFN